MTVAGMPTTGHNESVPSEANMANAPRLSDVKMAVKEGAKIKPVRHVPLPGTKPIEGGAKRKCCASSAGAGPHEPGCSNHPETPRKPKAVKRPSLKMRDDAESGRWPESTFIGALWKDGQWRVVAVGDSRMATEGFNERLAEIVGGGVIAACHGTAVHVLISQAFRQWMTAESMAEKTA